MTTTKETPGAAEPSGKPQKTNLAEQYRPVALKAVVAAAMMLKPAPKLKKKLA